MKTLIRNACVLTADAAGRMFEGGFVAIDAHGRIAAVGPSAQEPAPGEAAVIDARGAFCTPGLINMHQHLHMNLLKGLADGLLLEPWVFDFSAHSRKFMTREAVRASFTLAAMEMLRTGTTCVLNQQSPFAWPELHHDAAGLLSQAGLRQVLAISFQCRTPKLPHYPEPDEAARRIGALADELAQRHGSLVRPALAIECNAHHTHAGRSSDELVRTGAALAREKGLRVASHMSGGTLSMTGGFTKYRRQTGRSDVEYLEGLGVLADNWVLKHGIHFSDDDIATVARRGAHVVYTPTSESIRGGGLGPWQAMHEAGINTALGSDGPAVDYSVDMVEQMKACCYLQAVRYGHPAAVSARRAFEMATLGAARALALDAEIGSIEPGKRADIALFERSRPHLQLIADPLTAFVRGARGADAVRVLVEGRTVYEAGRYAGLADAQAAVDEAGMRARALAEAAGFAPRAQPRWPARAA